MRYFIFFLVFLVIAIVLYSQLPSVGSKIQQEPGFGTVATVEAPPTDTQDTTLQSLAASHSKASDDESVFVTGTERLPSSLRGTEVDGGFVLDEEGNLLVTRHIRLLFDYFLTAQGEEELPTILRRLRAYIHHQLEGEAAAQVEELLNSYIGYLAAVETLDSTVMPGQQVDLDLLSEQKDQLAALRGEYFDTVANEAFFKEEDNYDRYTIARLKIMEDAQLSSNDKAAHLAELRGQQSPELLELLDEVSYYQDLRQLTAEWQNSGGDATQLRAIRERVVGAEATERLERLDTERAAWQQRVDAWIAERERVLSNTNLSDEDKQAHLNNMLEERFNEGERLRVRSLESMR